MELNIETRIALFGLCLTSVFAVVGLFLNFLALRQSNRLAISSKLAEASKILSDELVSVSRARQLLLSELKEAEKHPNSPDKARKVAALSRLINEKTNRQQEIDHDQQVISTLFRSLENVSPAQIDEIISVSYSKQAIAKSSLDLMQDVKTTNA